LLAACRKILEAFRPLPSLTVSQWADTYRHLAPEYCEKPGRWRTSRVEYTREIMDALTDPEVETVVFVAGSQVAKTEILVNIIGYFSTYAPAPMLGIFPRQEDVRMFSGERLAPTIRDTPLMREKFLAPKSRSAGNTIAFKKFHGGNIALVGANAPSNLASRPRRIILSDEDDRQAVSAGVEGDPWELAWTRTKTFATRKGYRCSTPVLSSSRILAAFAKTDRRYYHVPCPRCGNLHVLEWGNVTWKKNQDGTPDLATVRLRCPHCGGLFSNEEKDVAVADSARARWVPTAPFNGARGYRISALYSPFINSTLEKIVAQFEASRGDPTTLQTFYNTVLGEPYDGISEKIDETKIAARAERYPAPVPRHVLALTLGADTQGDRLEAEIVGWDDAFQSWSIDYQVIPGDPNISEGKPGSPWTALTALLETRYRHELGFDIPITAAVIDAGGTGTVPHSVYDYCHVHRASIMPLKGANRPDADPVRLSRTRFGKGKTRHIFLLLAGVHKLKHAVAARLQVPEPGPGYCHFPEGRPPEYYEQLAAEHLVTKIVGNRRVQAWEKVTETARNEALDCRVYATAALLVKPPRWDWLRKRHGKLAALAAAQSAAAARTAPAMPPAAPAPPSAATLPKRRPSRYAGFWSSYR
jgi:phage terminase large subunit GpA-like protein